tara:strand:+ start:205 stop:399 length:195 start_codon:yes stop_codon:yes gene_type:complete
MRKLDIEKSIDRYQRFLQMDLEPSGRKRIERLLAEEQIALRKALDSERERSIQFGSKHWSGKTR